MPLKPCSEASIAPEWIRSSYSTDEGPDCVEVAARPDGILVRDSKNPDGPRLGLTRGAWAAFTPSV
ncbi:DUF397 domain-containing protein [Streptomyces sp. NPDC005070]